MWLGLIAGLLVAATLMARRFLSSSRREALVSAPVGRIHWAGAETSDVWNGYMDGAVRSGYRAAAAILDETDR